MSLSIGNKIIGKSYGDHPKWPNDRDFDEISALHASNTEALYKYNIPNKLELDKLIKPGDIAIDMGAGIGTFLAALGDRRRGVFLIAAGAHDLLTYFINKINKVYYGLFPESKVLLKDYIGRAKLITDNYGAFSYCNNPMYMLVYSALLLCKNGQYTSISSTTQGETPLSVLGTEKTWVKVKAFMKKWFKTDMQIIPTIIQSRVKPGEYFTDFIIKFKIPGHTYTFDDYETLCSAVDKEIGVPELGKDWFKADGSFALTEKKWPSDKEVETFTENNNNEKDT